MMKYEAKFFLKIMGKKLGKNSEKKLDKYLWQNCERNCTKLVGKICGKNCANNCEKNWEKFVEKMLKNCANIGQPPLADIQVTRSFYTKYPIQRIVCRRLFEIFYIVDSRNLFWGCANSFLKVPTFTCYQIEMISFEVK